VDIEEAIKRIIAKNRTELSKIGDYTHLAPLAAKDLARIYQELEVKLGKTQQTSDETYLGLTDEDFNQNPFRRYRGSQEDVFESDHEQYQARHLIMPAKHIDVTTLLYQNNFHRNWYKLQNVLGTSITNIFADTELYSAELDITRGSDSDPDALAVHANNRDYSSQGVQTVLGLRFDTGPKTTSNWAFATTRTRKIGFSTRMASGWSTAT
jgi:outer membrane receptor for Fe3+-dicitrate